MDRLFAVAGALSAASAVVAGAFGAHALESRLSAELRNTFEIGARYQMYHALALLAAARAVSRRPTMSLQVAGWSFIAGTVLFSGSLYLLCLSGESWLGAVTPFGGTAFILGWISLAWGIWKAPRI